MWPCSTWQGTKSWEWSLYENLYRKFLKLCNTFRHWKKRNFQLERSCGQCLTLSSRMSESSILQNQDSREAKRSKRIIANWELLSKWLTVLTIPRISDFIETMINQIIDKRRIAYLLKKLASKHNSRKGLRIYPINCEMFKEKCNEEKKGSEDLEPSGKQWGDQQCN